MHKFFCSYNPLTEKYELSISRTFNFKSTIQSENTLLNEIQNDLQTIYDYINIIKEKTNNEEKQDLLNLIELKISNVYYSLFASPLNLTEHSETNKDIKTLLAEAISITSSLIEKINIPEYNRICEIILNSLQNLLNKV